MAPAPAGVNEPVSGKGSMSRTGLRSRGVAGRVASADSKEDPEEVKEGLACVSRPSFDETQAVLLPAVVGGTVPSIALWSTSAAPLKLLCSKQRFWCVHALKSERDAMLETTRHSKIYASFCNTYFLNM